MPYFDHNATTPLCPAARAAWLRAADEAWQNASSPHRAGARVRALLEQARAALAAMLECAEDRLVFTSGATESANAALAHAASVAPAGSRLLLNPTEHPCVLAAAEVSWAGRFEFLPVSAAGVVDPAVLAARLAAGGVGLVAVMAANNETGVLQPWREISTACRGAGVPYLCDAAQWLGKLPAGGLGTADYLIGAAHKFGGPKGTGFLAVPAGAAGRGFVAQRGGDQQNGRRAGTEDFPGVSAMIAALAVAEQTKVMFESERVLWRDSFERRLCAALPGARVVGVGAERLWNTAMVLMPQAENHRWLTKLDKRGLQVSTGSACAAGKDAPSHVLAALGIPPADARRALRFSSGWETTEADWAALHAALVEVAAELA